MIFNYLEYILNESIKGSLIKKDREKMRNLLRHNIVTFKFQKRDGSIRTAVGTLHPDFLPPIKGTGGPKPEYQMVYYDLEKMEWRSFRSFKFIKIKKLVEITDDTIDELLRKKEEMERKKKEEEKKAARIKEREKEDREKEEKKDEEEKEKHKKHETEEPIKKEKHIEHKHEDGEKDHHEDKDKTFKSGEKIPEKELIRRSADFRKGSRKNKFTKKANDSFKKGEV